ncbi:hypothetical protein LPJ77_001120 [Coemansia sp. RSA 2523]|nr:hypothetical protein LPJ69_002195 [Coemansia sp. RSA 1752]KAJ1779719.1 hypothetical protein LPJ54_000689 [Coemansia sp. RSA 1824]KAJ1790357.1 hypothetical protein LPJ67_002182 [Coemansia sp. RSA 1938]KAJ1793713.1 hypothetical protein LPJ62_000035 [Coemansia sp. RSA 2167]KAJ1810167.1 hypothetical protein LPJ77_001120 [Coemansia sp. RSA 2523]
MSEKEYVKNIKLICELLQSDPTPGVILKLRESFETLSKQLKAGPFLEVFEATLSNIPFSALFSLLAAPDNKLIVTVAEVTGQLLKPVTWPMVHQTFEEYIIQGLAHPHPVVKALVLRQFLKCEQKADPLCDIGMAMDYLLSEESVSAIKTLLAGNESQRFRVYDVVAAAIKDSDSSFEFFRQEGIVDLLLKEGSAKDVLVAMNFYELVPTLCESSVPYEYIESAGVFKNVLEQVQQAKTDDSVTSSLLRLSALKLFSRMADAKGISPASFYGKYAIAPELAELVLLPEPRSDLKITAITCVGTIGNNPEALEYLASEKTALEALVTVYNTSIGQLRVECLRAIACIFGYSTTPSGAASQICYELYAKLDDGKFLVGLTKEIMKGFEESCVAGLAVIQKLVHHAWGLHEIASYQNIVNFLLMRDSSRAKVAQQWQFSVIESIVKAPEAKSEFDDETFARLERYAREGPYYAVATARVAVESS